MSYPWQAYQRTPKRLPHSLGFSKWCLTFNGVLSQFVNLGDVLDIGVNDLTYGCFFKTSTTGVLQGIISKRQSGAGNPGYRIFISNTNLVTVNFNDGVNPTFSITQTSPAGAFQDGRWHFVVVTIDRDGNMILYIDGRQENSVNVAASDGINVNTPMPLTIGTSDWATWNLTGSIDEVFLYFTVLSASDVFYNMLNYHKITGNPVCWLRFEEGAGLTAYDSIGGFNGSLQPVINPPIWARVKKWELRSEVGL